MAEKMPRQDELRQLAEDWRRLYTATSRYGKVARGLLNLLDRDEAAGELADRLQSARLDLAAHGQPGARSLALIADDLSFALAAYREVCG